MRCNTRQCTELKEGEIHLDEIHVKEGEIHFDKMHVKEGEG